MNHLVEEQARKKADGSRSYWKTNNVTAEVLEARKLTPCRGEGVVVNAAMLRF